MPCLVNFSPCDPLFFCFCPTAYAHSLFEKRFFFQKFMGNYWERNREREIFRLNRFPTIETKVIFCTVLRSKSNISLQFLLGIVEKQSKKKQVCCWLKNKEPGERKVRFWTLILMFFFHEKCQSLGRIKMQNLPCNTQLFLAFWLYPDPPQGLKKEKLRFHGKWKVSLDTLIIVPSQCSSPPSNW